MQAGEGETDNPKQKKFRQKKREVQCAVNLAQKLQPFVELNGDEAVSVRERFCMFVVWCVDCVVCRIVNHIVLHIVVFIIV